MLKIIKTAQNIIFSFSFDLFNYAHKFKAERFESKEFKSSFVKKHWLVFENAGGNSKIVRSIDFQFTKIDIGAFSKLITYFLCKVEQFLCYFYG